MLRPMVSVPLKLNLLIICGKCLGGFLVLFEAQLPTFPSVIQPPLSFKWGNASEQQIATLSEGVARLFCRMPAVRSRDIGFLWIWERGANRAGVRSQRYKIPTTMRRVKAADSQQATNHSLSSRSQKRLRAYHLLKLPQANLVTWFMPGIYVWF